VPWRLWMAFAALASAAPPGRADLPAYDPAACRACHASLYAPAAKHRAGDACNICHAPVAGAGRCRSVLTKAWRTTATCRDCHQSIGRVPHPHAPVVNRPCVACHEVHASALPGMLRGASAETFCYRCHEDDVTGRTSVHFPVAQGECNACHFPHGGGRAKGLRAEPGRELCGTCHSEIGATGTVHPALENGCGDCHDPHGSDRRALLQKEVAALCADCHTIDGRHVTSFSAAGHRMEGVPDPHAPERALSCVSCHDPHSSKSPKLLRWGASTMEFCDWCHGDRSGMHPELKDIHRVKRAPRGPAAAPGSPAGPGAAR